MSTAIVWFRRDLRLADNPALHHARHAHERVVCVYVHAPEDEAPWEPGAASLAYLDRSLRALSESLAKTGAPLVIRRGPAQAAIAKLIREAKAEALYFNRRYEPHLAAVDARFEGANTYNASLFVEPDAVKPYKVFTPYWRAVSATLEPSEPYPAPRRLEAPTLDSLSIDALALRPALGWDRDFPEAGEQAAQKRLAWFLDEALGDYGRDRDRPDLDGTSRLSAHLHFGEIGPRQILHAIERRGLRERAAKFLSELGWREFSYHLLHHHPHTPAEPLDAKFERFPWARRHRPTIRAWQRGRTGIPIVDAGMRQLWAEGWMHNRVRMIVASLFSKNLRIPWQDGARWFWDTLVDADLANNTQGWQWVAGSGADAAPYFRVFNPVLQGQRYDPDGDYVKRWVPELSKVPTSHVHAPWDLPRETLRALGLADTPYARPIVDLARSRDAALDAWRSLKA